MTFVGCDLHTRTQEAAGLDTRTGEVSEHQLVHDGRAVEEFYAALPRLVTVGIESTGDGLVSFSHAMPRAHAARRRCREDPRHGRSEDEDRPA